MIIHHPGVRTGWFRIWGLTSPSIADDNQLQIMLLYNALLIVKISHSLSELQSSMPTKFLRDEGGWGGGGGGREVVRQIRFSSAALFKETVKNTLGASVLSNRVGFLLSNSTIYGLT